MRWLALVCFGAMPSIAAAAGSAQAQPAPDSLESAAKAVEAAIASEEKTEALFALFDAEMRKAVPLAQLRGMLGDLRAGMGKVQSRKETSKPQPGAAAYRLGMERGELEMSLAVDGEGKIRGLLLRPPGATPEGARFDAVGANLEAAIRAGDAKGLARDFAASTRSALPESKTRELLVSLGGQLGKLRTRGASRRPSPDTAIWPLEFEKGTIDLKVVLDGEGKIIGIWFLPPGAAGDAPKASERNAVRLRLPFRGQWEVFWGGPTRDQNAHHDVANQRHAFDFVGLHPDGQRYRGAGTRNEDWAAYGREVLAPAGGRVTDVIEGVRDNRPGSMNPYAAVGNTVILRLSENEYAVFAHLKPGSVRVQTGQSVERGAVLGLCGNSGNSSEPHLHFHLQQTAVLQDGLGIRCHFEAVALDRGGRRETMTDYSPERGDVIVGE